MRSDAVGLEIHVRKEIDLLFEALNSPNQNIPGYQRFFSKFLLSKGFKRTLPCFERLAKSFLFNQESKGDENSKGLLLWPIFFEIGKNFTKKDKI